MNGVLQATLAILVAGGLHLAGFAALPPSEGTAPGAGEDGSELISLAPASGDLAALVEAWETPPDLTLADPVLSATMAPAIDTPPLAPALLDTPVLPKALPPLAPLPEAALRAPEPPPAPETAPETAPEITAKPKPRPERAKTKPPKAAAQGQKAKGSGDGTAAGTGGKSTSSTLTKGQTNSLRATWGGAIRAKIESRKRYPAAAGNARGKVTLRLVVARNGALGGVSVAQSSGNAALDRAAVAAVTRAGRFPAAPKGLDEASYSFSLPITFAR